MRRSDPPSRVDSFAKGSSIAFFSSYYEDSVAMRVSSFRRSRFCTGRTFSVFRCPSVPFQAHCLPLAEESVPSTTWTLTYYGILPRLMPVSASPLYAWCGGYGKTSCGNSGSTVPVSPCTQDLQDHIIHAFWYFLLRRHATVHHWLSPPGKSLSWRSFALNLLSL